MLSIILHENEFIGVVLDELALQWNSVNKSTSGQPVLDLIRGGFNKRRFLKCTKCSIFSVFIPQKM